MAKVVLGELLAQKAALEKQIADAQRTQRADAITQIKTLLAEYGLTLADISSSKPAKPAKTAAAPAPAKKVKAKVAAKYRNTATGETWSGRGLKPKWLTAALATGKTLADFVI
jgi:DNA-binding protein H-NS